MKSTTKKFWRKTWLDFVKFILILLQLSLTSRRCRSYYKEARNHSYDMVIVPGIPFNGIKWDFIMKGRVYWAKYLFDEGIAKNIMFSGAAVHTPWMEGKTMALFAEAIGIPQEHIFTEDQAEHSTENVFLSYKKACGLGCLKIGFASDPVQTKVLRKFITKKVSDKIALIPIVYDLLRIIENDMTDPVIDHSKTFVKDFIPLKKREKFQQRFNGTLGGNIVLTETIQSKSDR